MTIELTQMEDPMYFKYRSIHILTSVNQVFSSELFCTEKKTDCEKIHIR